MQVVIVTPEHTVLDQACEAVVVPLFDGEAGILPGHASMIGRLGPGEVRFREGSNTHRYYVDGGFVQVASDQVSVLTGRAIPADQINVEQARADLANAEKMATDSSELRAAREKAVGQARAQIRMADRI